MREVNREVLKRYLDTKITYIESQQDKIDRNNLKKLPLYHQYEGVLNSCYELIIDFRLNITDD